MIWVDLLGAEVRFLGTKFRTRVIECGEGETLVMLHGGGGHAEAFARNVVRLGQRFHVMAIDMVWHGLSSKPPFPGQALPTYAAQVVDLLDTLGIDKAHVEGEAIGGRVALWLGIHRPDRLRKLVLNNTGGVNFKDVEDRGATRNMYQQDARAAIDQTTRDTVRARMQRLFVDKSLVTDELVETRYRFYSDPETNRAQAAIVMEPDFEEEEVGRITAPALVLAADHNPLRGPDAGERLARLIPGARCHVFHNSAIWLQWEEAEEHDRVVAGFLEGS
jgi:pimeloyl-ACP methyl ester carboxylesterase